VVNKFDYAFAENGLTAYKLGQELPSQSFIKWLGEDKYKPLVKFILHYIADLDLPIKRSVRSLCGLSSDVSYRGTFVEFRNGMVNVSPIGRNAS
jgi:phosphomannomutase